MMWTRACSPTGRPIEICGVLLFLVCSPLAGPRRTVRGSSVNGKECWWSVSAWRTTQRTQASGTDRVCQTRRASAPQRLPPVTRSAPGTALRRARDCRLRVTSTLRPTPWSPPYSITCLSSCGNSQPPVAKHPSAAKLARANATSCPGIHSDAWGPAPARERRTSNGSARPGSTQLSSLCASSSMPTWRLHGRRVVFGRARFRARGAFRRGGVG
ncbi:hypothetical protein BC628DRAFT_1378610 [Trametes gibbosa]|nr:hypothetical protein BC628DRAFT_1378610 [Trametes gibbosa]